MGPDHLEVTMEYLMLLCDSGVSATVAQQRLSGGELPF